MGLVLHLNCILYLPLAVGICKRLRNRAFGYKEQVEFSRMAVDVSVGTDDFQFFGKVFLQKLFHYSAGEVAVEFVPSEFISCWNLGSSLLSFDDPYNICLFNLKGIWKRTQIDSPLEFESMAVDSRIGVLRQRFRP